MSAALWHYTCAHAAHRINGELLPASELAGRPADLPLGLQEMFVWLTDLERPVREALGLTQVHTREGCDRLDYRYRVTNASQVRPWMEVRKIMPRELRTALEWRAELRPANWYVSAVAVPVEADSAYWRARAERLGRLERS